MERLSGAGAGMGPPVTSGTQLVIVISKLPPHSSSNFGLNCEQFCRVIISNCGIKVRGNECPDCSGFVDGVSATSVHRSSVKL